MTQTAVTDLYSTSPGVAEATASQATASTAASPSPMVSQDAEASYAGTRDAAAMSGQASGYSAETAEVDPNTMTSAGQMTSITGQDSPLMQRARSEGLLAAGRRGLMNSSIAAGSAMGSMVDRATPLALQDAQTYFAQSRANQDATNQASAFSADAQNRMEALNTQLGTDVSLANARAENEAAQLNAQLETAVSQGNAEEANRIQTRLAELQTEVDLNNAANETNVSLANADAQTRTSIENAAQTNAMNERVMSINAALNEQFLRGEQANDLATIQGRYQQLIASNETAARLYDSYFQAIGSVMSNPDITPERVAQYVGVQQDMLDAGLRMMDAINTLDLGDFALPGVYSTGSGNNSDITSTPGTGPTGPGPADPIAAISEPAPTTGDVTIGLPTGTEPDFVGPIPDSSTPTAPAPTVVEPDVADSFYRTPYADTTEGSERTARYQ